MAYDGINRLGRVLQGRMKEMSSTAPNVDLATIRSDLALVLDDCEDIIIPRDEYNVMNTSDCEYDRWRLRGGDRVVIAWIGSDVVVLGKLGR